MWRYARHAQAFGEADRLSSEADEVQKPHPTSGRRVSSCRWIKPGQSSALLLQITARRDVS